MEDYLKRGNIFKLEEGMEVCAKLPEKFFYSDKAFSKEYKEINVTIGDKFSTSEQLVLDNIKEQLHNIFEVNKVNIDRAKIDKAFEELFPCVGEEHLDTIELLEGEYIVLDTIFNSFASHISLKVIAKKLKDGKIDTDGIEVSFYQYKDYGRCGSLIKPESIEYVGDFILDNLK